MRPPSRSATATRRPPSRGVAMIIVLMFMLALTGLAVFSARYATMGETMAANQLDQERARQAAEAALRDAERDLLLPQIGRPAASLCDRTGDRPVVLRLPAFTPDCARGQCAPLPLAAENANWVAGTNPEVWWPAARNGLWNDDAATKPSDAAGANVNCDFTGGVPLGTFTGADDLPGVARQPEYLIEYYQRGSGRTGDFFRITARGFGLNANTEVVLQTYFQPFIIQ